MSLAAHNMDRMDRTLPLILPRPGAGLLVDIIDHLVARGRIVPEAPRAALVVGPEAAGKTTLRRRRFGSGYAPLDAGEIFLALGGQELPFPSVLEESVEHAGSAAARRAIAERRNVVCELIGDDCDAVDALIRALRRIGYRVALLGVSGPPAACRQRERARADEDISARLTQEFHLRWLLDAAQAARAELNTAAP